MVNKIFDDKLEAGFLSLLFLQNNTMDQQTIISILISILTISSGIFIVILQRKTEKIKIIENQLSEKKYKAYSELIEIFYNIFKDTKNNKPINNQNLTLKLIDIKKDLFIYGSDEIFRKFTDWLCFSTENSNNLNHMNYFLDLMIAIRRDMGKKDTSLTKHEIMLNIIQDKKVLDEFSQYWK